MARPPKKSLSYSTWAVDVLENDTTIDKLIDAQGPAGFFVYFALCQKAYATEGYFYRWGLDDAASTARKLGGGLSSAQVRAIAELCLSLGLFDKDLFSGYGILTSRAIQKRYLDGIARRVGGIEIIVEYWLLDVKPAAGVIFVHENGVIAYKNPCLEQQKQGSCTVDYIKQDDIKPPNNSPQESGAELRRETCTRVLALYQSFGGLNCQGKADVRKKVYDLLSRGYTETDLRAVVGMAAAKSRANGLAIPNPEQLFGGWFEMLIKTRPDPEHPEWNRDNYTVLPKRGGPRSFNGGF